MRKPCLALGLGLALAFGGELEVKKDFVPEECEQKTAAGHFVHMHYTGTIDASSAAGEGGKKFDSSRDRGDPFTFKLGGGIVFNLSTLKGAARPITTPSMHLQHPARIRIK